MLEIVILAVLLTFVAAAGLWTFLLAVRAAGRRRNRRRRSAERALLEAIRGFRRSGERTDMIEAVARIDAAILFELVPRALAGLRGEERDAFETALARRRFARHLRRNFRRFDETRRILACELLAALGGERSIAFLFRALRDRGYRVRIAAAIALARRGELGDASEAVGRLGKRARRSGRLVQMFAPLLPERRAEVEGIAGDVSQDPFVRVSALRALAAEALLADQLLLRLSKDRSPVVVMAAGALSVEHRLASAPLILEAMLASPSPAVRREAAARACALRGDALAPRLRDALRDRDSAVASAAARAIVAAKRGAPERRLPGEPPALLLIAAADAAAE